MRFACDRCGKRYASVDEPVRGRVYRIRCRCGHVISVRGPPAPAALRVGTAPPLASPGPDEWAEGAPAATARGPVPAPPPIPVPPPVTAPPPVTRAPAPAASPEESPEESPATTGPRGLPPAPAPREEGRVPEGVADAAPGQAALAPAPARPALSLGLDGEGPGAARRRVVVAALLAIAALGASLVLLGR